MSVQVAAFREALAALHSGPETTVGEAVVGFCGVEILCELALRDVGDEADMRERRSPLSQAQRSRGER